MPEQTSFDNGITIEKALLIGVNVDNDRNFEHSFKELFQLAEACNFQVAGALTQNLPAVNTAIYMGSGKLEEVRALAASVNADLLIFDNALTPTQLRNLQKELDYPILDRTSLILEIFSSRARTSEAKLQVELAKLQYMLPRLVGLHASLGRQGGASGSMSNKGAGEKKLELDRRRIEHRITELKKNLEAVKLDRQTQRKQRSQSALPQAALVGYTNAGKSTVMNRLLSTFSADQDKLVLEKNMLFATLDTTVRKIQTPDNRAFLLSDTVGFIDKLPHNLIQAFRSTLEEVKNADLLLEVIDFSDPDYKEHIQVTKDTLEELGAGDIPILYLYNKADQVEECSYPVIVEDKLYFSAKDDESIRVLLSFICDNLYSSQISCEFLFPYTEGGKVSYLMEHASVLEQEYLESGIRLLVNCTQEDAGRFFEYKI